MKKLAMFVSSGICFGFLLPYENTHSLVGAGIFTIITVVLYVWDLDDEWGN